MKYFFYQRLLNPDSQARLMYVELLRRLRQIGGPIDNMGHFTKVKCFKSMNMFCRIQREVEQLLIDKADLGIQWNVHK